MKTYGIYKRHGLTLYDFVAITCIAFLLYGVVATAKRWSGVLTPSEPISLSFNKLPLYAVYSLFRNFAAYFVSFAFAIVTGYIAAKNKTAEKIILPLLDIGQSIPVLGFLPGLVLGLIGLFPNSNFGLEVACILMIATSQTWNMCFSFHASLKGVPESIQEMSTIAGLSRPQRLFKIELPYAATGLAWNSLVSMAGGWFFLTVCEAFTLENRNFRLPGLGSYMATAIEQGNRGAMGAGIAAMFVVIVLLDFLVWRPIVAWTAKFKADDENTEGGEEIPFMSLLLKESPVVQEILNFFKGLFSHLGLMTLFRRPHIPRYARIQFERFSRKGFTAVKILLATLFFIFAFSVIGKLYVLLSTLTIREGKLIIVGSLYSFLRVFSSVAIASLWTIPVGILTGLSPRLTRILQPIIQVAASFPAPMIFPLVLVVLSYFGVRMGIGASLLMLVAVQWYMLFNVLAGSIGISHQLRDSFRLMGVSKKDTWLKLYLPSIFPSLVTGWITATGSAWNASIVSEYMEVNNKIEYTLGLGSLISNATAHANYDVLGASLLMMVMIVVATNRLLWQPLLQISETRFQMEQR